MAMYDGESEGLKNLVTGYLDYAEEVIINRAVPDLRDGLKPSQRRIVYTAHNDKTMHKSEVLSHVVTSEANKLHPHGEGSLYEAYVRLVDAGEYTNVPLFTGKSNFGKMYQGGKEAAARYTKAKLHNNIYDFFTAPKGMEWKDSEVGEGKEPSALTVNYPYVLTVGAQGIAVGVATKIPSFNFWDIIDLTEKYVKEKSFSDNDIIYPDYASGGHYIVDNTEALKIMRTGRGKIKVRADIEIRGADIVVHEVPMNMTTGTINKRVSAIINDKDNPLSAKIRSSREAIEYGNTEKVVITCRSKGVVEEVLMYLFQKSILQNSITTSLITVNDGLPVLGGVFTVIEEWVKWRKGILKYDFERELEDLRANIIPLDHFIKLVEDKPARDEFLNILTNTSRNAGIEYLLSERDVDRDSADWITGRRADSFLDGGKERRKYEDMIASIEEFELRLADLDGFIVEELEDIRKSHKGMHERKTKLTTKDYRFTKRVADTEEVKASNVVDNSPAVFTVYKNGILTKTRRPVTTVDNNEVLNIVEGTASTNLIGFDMYGRVLKLFGDEVPFSEGSSSGGMYLPRYFGITDEYAEEGIEYNTLYMGELDGSERLLLFNDGMISFLNTDKWYDAKAKHRVVNKGVNEAVYENLVDVIEQKDIPEVMLVACNGRPNMTRYSVIDMETVRHPKGSSGRAKVVRGSDLNIQFWGSLSRDEIDTWVDDDNPDRFKGRINSPRRNKFNLINIDVFEVLNEPKYGSVVSGR